MSNQISYIIIEVMADIVLNKRLPNKLVIESVDDILYRIGLTLTSSQNQIKRSFIFNPTFIFIYVSIYAIKEFVIFLLNEENDFVFKLIGSHGHLLGVRQHISMSIILFSMLSLSSQAIHYYNYRNGIKPTFLRVFIKCKVKHMI